MPKLSGKANDYCGAGGTNASAARVRANHWVIAGPQGLSGLLVLRIYPRASKRILPCTEPPIDMEATTTKISEGLG